MRANRAASKAIFVIAETSTMVAESRSIDSGIPSPPKSRSAGLLTLRASMAAPISCVSLLVAAGKNPSMVSAKPRPPPMIEPFADAFMLPNGEHEPREAAAVGSGIWEDRTGCLPLAQCSGPASISSRSYQGSHSSGWGS
jgi:hypothetical protein